MTETLTLAAQASNQWSGSLALPGVTAGMAETIRLATQVSNQWSDSLALPGLTARMTETLTLAAQASNQWSGSLALPGVTAGMAEAIRQATQATNGTGARLLALERGFLKGSGTAADFFGDLDVVVNGDRELNGHLRRAVAATQHPGSFGLDYKALQSNASDLADRFDNEPDLEKQVRSALEPVQEITGLTDDLLIDFGEALGWWRRITRHKVSTAGIIAGFTIGLTSFVFNEGTGSMPGPPASLASIILGGTIYLGLRKLEIPSTEPPK